MALRVEHRSKQGRATIILREADGVTMALPNGNRFAVTALDGHELLPVTRSFKDEQCARAYANQLWGRY